MPSAKNGKPCTLVSPVAPQAAQDADDATAGKVDQAGVAGTAPHTPAAHLSSTHVGARQPIDSGN